MHKNYESMKKYLKAYREDADLSGGRAAGLPDSDFNKSDMEIGRKIEMEHTNDPNIAKEISKDHLEEHKFYYQALTPMEDMLEQIEEKAACTKYQAYRIVLAAAVQGDFNKQIPVETQKFINKNPETAQKFFTPEMRQTHPDLKNYLNQITQKKQPVRQDILQNLSGMTGELNTEAMQRPQVLANISRNLTGNPDQDWKAVEAVASPKLVQYLKYNTMIKPQQFLAGLQQHGADLTKIITPETLV